MSTPGGPRRGGLRRRTGTLVSGAAVAAVVGALLIAATGGMPSDAAHPGTTNANASTDAASRTAGTGGPDVAAGATTATGTHHSNSSAASAKSKAGTATGTGDTSMTGAVKTATATAHTAGTTNAANATPAGAKAAGTAPGAAPTTPTTTGAAAAPNPNAPCLGTTPLGLAGNWTCTFDDEFDGTSLDTSKWVPQLTSTSGYLNGATACYVDNPDTVSVSGGTLNLSVRQVAPFTCSYPGGSFETSYEAGMVSTYGLFDQTYGAFEVSAKLPAAAVSGLQETMWLYPQNLTYGPWPSSGEIDFAEFFSQYPNLDVPYVHYANSSSDPGVTAYDCTLDQSSFNTYEVDWESGTITVLYNGRTCLVDHPTTGSEPFDQPFFIALTQALGVDTNAFSAASTPLPATTQVDWVRAWSRSS